MICRVCLALAFGAGLSVRTCDGVAPDESLDAGRGGGAIAGAGDAHPGPDADALLGAEFAGGGLARVAILDDPQLRMGQGFGRGGWDAGGQGSQGIGRGDREHVARHVQAHHLANLGAQLLVFVVGGCGIRGRPIFRQRRMKKCGSRHPSLVGEMFGAGINVLPQLRGGVANAPRGHGREPDGLGHAIVKGGAIHIGLHDAVVGVPIEGDGADLVEFDAGGQVLDE